MLIFVFGKERKAREDIDVMRGEQIQVGQGDKASSPSYYSL